MMKIIAFVLFFAATLFGEYYYEFGKKVVVYPLKEKRELGDFKYYKTKDGKKIAIKNEIVLKLKDGVDPNSFFSKYEFKSIQKIAKNTYLIKLKKDQDLFTLANKLFKSKETIYAIPNKVKKYKKR